LLELVGTVSGGDDLRSHRASKVARCKTHAAAGPVDENGLSGPQSADFDEGHICGLVSGSHCGRAREIQTGGNGPERGCGEGGIFGKRPRLCTAAHFVARLEPTRFRCFDDFAGHFEPGHQRHVGFELVFALRHQQVRVI